MRVNRSIPAASVIPELAYADVPAAAAWLCAAFGFSERLRIAGHRVQLVLGDGAVVVVQSNGTPPAGHGLLVRVEDVDAHCERARRAGAVIVGEPTTWPYGERQYGALDPGGHRWTFSQTVADVDPADWGGTLV